MLLVVEAVLLPYKYLGSNMVRNSIFLLVFGNFIHKLSYCNWFNPKQGKNIMFTVVLVSLPTGSLYFSSLPFQNQEPTHLPSLY